jgi:exodeoxyribonuclease III
MALLLSWNIQHGGGSRIEAIQDAIDAIAPDVLVVTEFRNNISGKKLRKSLNDQGLIHQQACHANPNQNTILLAARQPFQANTFETQLRMDSHRCLQAEIYGFTLYGFYFTHGRAKIPVFEFILSLPKEYLQAPSILIGDFNSGKHYIDEKGATFSCVNYFGQIEDNGWIDAWRYFNKDLREFSWFSNAGNGFRIDHAFASPAMMSRITAVRYLHDHRKPSLSDHSALLLQFM